MTRKTLQQVVREGGSEGERKGARSKEIKKNGVNGCGFMKDWKDWRQWRVVEGSRSRLRKHYSSLARREGKRKSGKKEKGSHENGVNGCEFMKNLKDWRAVEGKQEQD